MKLDKWINGVGLEDFPYTSSDNSQELVTTELIGQPYEQPEHIQQLVDLRQNEDELVKASETIVALEAYMGILSKGTVSETATRLISTGLEQYGCLSEETTSISLESLADALKGAAAKLKELLLKAWEIAKHAYVSLANDIERLRPVAEKIKQRLAAAGNAKGGATIDIENPGKLMASETFKGQDITPIMGLAVFASKVYPKQVSTYINQLSAAIKQAMVEGDDDNLINAVNAIQTPLSGLRHSTEILPGNVKPAENDAGSFTELRDLSKLIASRSLRLEKVVRTPPASIQITGGSPQQLAERLTQILQTMDLISSIKNNAQQLAPAIKKLTDTVAWLESDKAYQQANSQNRTYRSANNQLITGLSAVSKMFGTDMTEVLQYCYRTVTAYLAVLSQEVNALEASA